MRLLHVTFADPAENLACDEVLLNRAEAEQSGEVLRFWESARPFVVVGLTQSVADEVNTEVCARDEVPILRRCSAGGAVVQCPGSLNYALVLDQSQRLEMRSIRGSYEAILGAIADAFRADGIQVRFEGISDLAVHRKKVSGNSQKRKRRYILHHGTLLYGDCTSAMARYLKEPTARPEYRGERTHTAFVDYLPLSPETIQRRVAHAFRAWDPPDQLTAAELDDVASLAVSKYRNPDWTHRMLRRHK